MSISQPEINKKRPFVSKKFFNKEERKEIEDLLEQKIKPKEIAKRFNTSPRHIREIKKQLMPNITRKWTEEEDQNLILYYCDLNITRAAILKNFFPTKLPHMIRNRIKYLRSKSLLPVTNSISQGNEEIYEFKNFDEFFEENDSKVDEI